MVAAFRVVAGLAFTVALILGISKPASAVIVSHDRKTFVRFNESRAEVTPTSVTFWMLVPHPDPVWKWGAPMPNGVDEYDFQVHFTMHGNRYCFCLYVHASPGASLRTGSLADLLKAGEAGLYELNPTKPDEEFDMLDGYTVSVSAWPSDADRGVVVARASAVTDANSGTEAFSGVKFLVTDRTVVERFWQYKPETVEYEFTGGLIDAVFETVSVDYAVPMRAL